MFPLSCSPVDVEGIEDVVGDQSPIRLTPTVDVALRECYDAVGVKWSDLEGHD